MKILLFLKIFFLVANNVFSEEWDPRIPCRLEWRPFSSGDAIPENAVLVNRMYFPKNVKKKYILFILNVYILHSEFGGEELEYVGRVWLTNTTFGLGRIVDSTIRNGYFVDPFEKELVDSTTFDLLTNPYGCILHWSKRQAQSDYLVVTTLDFEFPFSPTEQGFVGRASYSGEWIVGHVNENVNSISLPIFEEGEMLVFLNWNH